MMVAPEVEDSKFLFAQLARSDVFFSFHYLQCCGAHCFDTADSAIHDALGLYDSAILRLQQVPK